MIRRSCEVYESFREPRHLRLRRSSRRKEIEDEYIKIYNMEEHILYRKQELGSIHQTLEYYKNKNKILIWLNKICGVYNDDSEYELLGKYLIGESNVEKKADSKKIIECRLNLKDKKMRLGELYACHCMNLLDHFSYKLLTHV